MIINNAKHWIDDKDCFFFQTKQTATFIKVISYGTNWENVTRVLYETFQHPREASITLLLKSTNHAKGSQGQG